jgi:hypothetical protein
LKRTHAGQARRKVALMTEPSQPLPPDEEAKASKLRTSFERVFKRFRLKRDASPNAIEDIVRRLDAGELDTMIDGLLPTPDPTRPRRRYADSLEFSHDAWKRRHNVPD